MGTDIITAKGRKEISDYLNLGTPEFVKAMPKDMNVETFKRVALTTIFDNPNLLSLNRESLMVALLKAAGLGLNCDGTMGEAYLVPYGNKVQLIIGYKGLVSLALSTGKYEDIGACVVYSMDKFEISLGTNRYIKHIPYDGEDRGSLKSAYAYAVTNTGRELFEHMNKYELEAHGKQYSKGYSRKDSIWQNNVPAAWKKTVIRRLSNCLLLSVKAQQVMAIEKKMDAEMDIPEEKLEEVIDVQEVNDDVQTPPADDTNKTGNNTLLGTLEKQDAGKTVDTKADEIIKETKKHLKEKNQDLTEDEQFDEWKKNETKPKF